MSETCTTARPMNGNEYLRSLDDGREVWIYGERVKKVTDHPAFRNASRMIARLYDALHRDGSASELTAATDTGSGGFTHAFFRAPRSAEDLTKARDAIAAWARLSYGWIARSPDYKAAFLVSLGANPAFHAPYEANALRWYRCAQEQVLFISHAIVDPPVDRDRPVDEVQDVFVNVTRETDKGIRVSGAKVIATGAALTHHCFVGRAGPMVNKPEFASIFVVPIASPGVKLLCRASYAMAAEAVGSPFDYPLSSRMDENDAILVLDDVEVPWENVLVHRDPGKANTWVAESGFSPRFVLHSCTRLAVKLDFLSGLLLNAVETTGTSSFRGVQAACGEVLAWRNAFWALSDAMVRSPTAWRNGTVIPNEEFATAAHMLTDSAYPAIRQTIERTLASGLVYVNSHASDFLAPELRPYLDRYLRGSNGRDAQYRVKLMKLLWDAVGTEFAGRQNLYEQHYGGSHEVVRLGALNGANASGLTGRLREFADRCMGEYDLHGWTAPDLAGSGP